MNLPHNLEAERALLGGLMLDAKALDDVAGVIAPGDFYKPAHGAIFRACCSLSNRGEPIGLLEVTTELGKSRSEVGGATYLSELTDAAVSAANTKYYAKLVADCSLLRRTILTCQEIARRAQETTDVQAFMEEAEREFFAIAAPQKSGAVRLGDVLPEFYKQLEYMKENGGAVTGLESGLTDLDSMTGGFHDTDLIILAARPGAGKSALALNVAEHVSIKLNKGVGFFSLEMSREQLEKRLFSGLSGVDLWRINRGLIRTGEWEPLARAGKTIEPAQLWVDDTAALTPHELRARARRLSRVKGVNLGLVIVDYLQLMRVPGSRSREQEIAEVSRALKAMAKELRVPVLALAQLNRQVEERNPPIPRMSDLRDSGQIEQDADLILFIYRADVYRDDRLQHDGKAVVIVGKQRNGPTGAVDVRYLAERTKFVNAEVEYAR